jgi:hypothetical protein
LTSLVDGDGLQATVVGYPAGQYGMCHIVGCDVWDGDNFWPAGETVDCSLLVNSPSMNTTPKMCTCDSITAFIITDEGAHKSLNLQRTFSFTVKNITPNKQESPAADPHWIGVSACGKCTIVFIL